MAELLPEMIYRCAERAGDRTALVMGDRQMNYADLAQQVRAFSGAVLEFRLQPAERVGIFLEKRFEAVVAMFGASAAGCTFVPINPLYRELHCGHILRDCNVRLLVTSRQRLSTLQGVIGECGDLRAIILIDAPPDETAAIYESAGEPGFEIIDWHSALAAGAQNVRQPHRRICDDMTAIFYTSGSTGMQKGVVVPHRSLTVGANSICEYLGHTSDDRLLAALALSFDAGFIQLTTAFNVGASSVLVNYVLPGDVINAIARERVTGLTGVPPLFIQLSRASWPEDTSKHLRYIASTGGTMPPATIQTLQSLLPETRIFVMYGMTETHRSTYLPPDQLERRPGSMGRAIPNVEILVAGEDGRICGPGEEGELVHRGPLIALGYWNDPEQTGTRFRPAPAHMPQLSLPEIAVWSGDIVRADEDGYLYFVGRRDEMIKTSGIRVGPAEIEAVVYESGLVGDAVCLGMPHPTLGQGIVLIAAAPHSAELDKKGIVAACRRRLPNFMIPHVIVERSPLPLNTHGKFDRKLLRQEFADIFQEEASP